MPNVQVNREELPGKEAPAQRAVCSRNRGWELTELSNVRTRERVLRRPIRAAAAHPRGWEEEANPLSTASFSPDTQQCPPFQARVRGVSFAANTSRGSRHFQTQELREQRPRAFMKTTRQQARTPSPGSSRQARGPRQEGPRQTLIGKGPRERRRSPSTSSDATSFSRQGRRRPAFLMYGRAHGAELLSEVPCLSIQTPRRQMG